MNREYYVYEYWRLDNNTCFYVGKGKGYRYKELRGRSTHFMNILNKVPCAVVIVEDNLTEEQALALEQDLIHQYVFEEGYSIGIKGYDTRAKGYLVNCTWGGEGTSGRTMSDETKRKMSEKHAGKTHSDETKRKISEKQAGDKNPMYGRTGDKNPMYGRTGAKSPRYGMTGAKHPNSRKVMCLNTGEVFNCLVDAKKWAGLKSYSGISGVCRGKRKTAGKHPVTGEPLKWKYAD